MRDVPASCDPRGFVVEWQLIDDGGDVIDLTTDQADTEVTLADPPVAAAGS